MRTSIEQSKGLLGNIEQIDVLFSFFAKIYDVHDAESVFSWAAKHYKFSEPRKDASLSPGPWWIKSK